MLPIHLVNFTEKMVTGLTFKFITANFYTCKNNVECTEKNIKLALFMKIYIQHTEFD